MQCSGDMTLNREQFVKTIRSLGIVLDTVRLYELFSEHKSKHVSWEQFLESYIVVRNQKGSFKEVDKAVDLLEHEYNGRWEQLFVDLRQLGDVLSEN